jgi:hypothetical protein
MSIDSNIDSHSPPPRGTQMTPDPTESTENDARYLEVWGDTVVGRDLAVSVVIGVTVSVAALLGATALFSSFVEDEALADAYALLVGIGSCLIAGVVCGKLFRPKRNIALESTEGAKVDDVIATLKEERRGLGSVDDLPAATVRELKELNLYERFRAAEADGNGDR